MADIFFPFQIAKMALSEVKKAYSSQRSIANKRLGRLEKAGLGTSGAFRFPRVRDLTEAQLRQGLAETSLYLRDKRHTVSGERAFMAHEIQMLRDQGYDFIDESNFYEFTEYMDDLRQQYGNKAFDSGDAADVFSQGQKIGIDPQVLKDNFEYFAENLDKLDRMRPARSEWGASFEGVKQKIGKLSK
jgi:biotin operon repressor